MQGIRQSIVQKLMAAPKACQVCDVTFTTPTPAAFWMAQMASGAFRCPAHQ